MPTQSKWESLPTEAINPATLAIDKVPVSEIVDMAINEDKKVIAAVQREKERIAHGVEIITQALRKGGRIIFIGAGTSGRLGVLDASECPPTFGSDPSMVQGVMAGGYGALVRAVEGAEDRTDEGEKAMADLGVGPRDTVIGLAASRRTPFVVAALAAARGLRARTAYITCTPRSEFALDVDVAICPVVGPEAIMGSTRMKAGTAQKLVLNMITTASMIRRGKTLGNLMIDLRPGSAKLVERGRGIVMRVVGCDYGEAVRLLDAAGGSVKTAIVMGRAGLDRPGAERRLEGAGGVVRRALAGGG